MCFVYKEPIHTQLLERHHIIFAALIVEFIQLGLQPLFGAFHLLDGEVVPTALLQVADAVHNLLKLLLQNGSLPLYGHRNFLQLGVADDDSVVIAGGNAATESLAVFRLKVLLGGYQDVGRGIKLEILGGPLFGQVVGNGDEGFAAQPQPLALLGSGDNFKSFPCPHNVCQQRISTV